jgi:hypothetical protein
MIVVSTWGLAMSGADAGAPDLEVPKPAAPEPTPAVPSPPQVAAPIAKPRSNSEVAIDRRRESALQRAARDLVADSHEAFRRGLLKLSDHAQQVAAARELELRLTELPSAAAAREKVLVGQALLWRNEAAQLARLNQPAARGWAADVSLARLLSARADEAWAEARHDRQAAAMAARQATAFSQQHLELRRADLNVGLATIADVTKAILALGGAPRDTSAGREAQFQPAEDWGRRRDRLQELVTWAAPLAGRGAPRIDAELILARMQLARAEALDAVARRDSRRAEASFRAARALGQEWFETQWNFYRARTGSLFEVADAWRAREMLQAEMTQAGYPAPAQAESELRADLDRVTQLAQGIGDLRGRMAADVAFVAVLQGLESLPPRLDSAAPAASHPNAGAVGTYEPASDLSRRSSGRPDTNRIPPRRELRQPAPPAPASPTDLP